MKRNFTVYGLVVLSTPDLRADLHNSHDLINISADDASLVFAFRGNAYRHADEAENVRLRFSGVSNLRREPRQHDHEPVGLESFGFKSPLEEEGSDYLIEAGREAKGDDVFLVLTNEASFRFQADEATLELAAL